MVACADDGVGESRCGVGDAKVVVGNGIADVVGYDTTSGGRVVDVEVDVGVGDRRNVTPGQHQVDSTSRLLEDTDGPLVRDVGVQHLVVNR